MGFQRDSVLNVDERNTSARKWLALLEDYTERMTAKELGFIEDMPVRRFSVGVVASLSFSGYVIW